MTMAQQNHSGAAPAMMMPNSGDDEQQAVDGRVEDLAELADLAEAPGEVAVDPVGGPESAEQPGRGGRVVASEQEVQEQRQAGQPEQGEQVGDGEDPVRRRRSTERTVAASNRAPITSTLW